MAERAVRNLLIVAIPVVLVAAGFLAYRAYRTPSPAKKPEIPKQANTKFLPLTFTVTNNSKTDWTKVQLSVSGKDFKSRGTKTASSESSDLWDINSEQITGLLKVSDIRAGSSKTITVDIRAYTTGTHTFEVLLIADGRQVYGPVTKNLTFQP